MRLEDTLRLTRCCDAHPSWNTLGAHLARDFAEVDAAVVARELAAARSAVESVRLDDEALFIAELIARQQLSMLTGRVSEVARLDPERRARRGTRADAAPQHSHAE